MHFQNFKFLTEILNKVLAFPKIFNAEFFLHQSFYYGGVASSFYWRYRISVMSFFQFTGVSSIVCFKTFETF